MKIIVSLADGVQSAVIGHVAPVAADEHDETAFKDDVHLNRDGATQAVIEVAPGDVITVSDFT